MSARLTRILLGAALFVGVGPTIAFAQSTDRCSGTFCDYFYGNAPSNPSSPAPSAQPQNGQTPLAVPSSNFLGKLFSGGATQPAGPGTAQPGTASSATNSLVNVQGSGLVSGLAGTAKPSRCSGTFCDLYYGGAAPQEAEPAAQGAGATADATPQPAADDTAPARPRRRAVEVQEKPRCVSPANDPWRCYR